MTLYYSGTLALGSHSHQYYTYKFRHCQPSSVEKLIQACPICQHTLPHATTPLTECVFCNCLVCDHHRFSDAFPSVLYLYGKRVYFVCGGCARPYDVDLPDDIVNLKMDIHAIVDRRAAKKRRMNMIATSCNMSVHNHHAMMNQLANDDEPSFISMQTHSFEHAN